MQTAKSDDKDVSGLINSQIQEKNRFKVAI